MNAQTRLNQEQKEAMLNHDKDRLDTIRLVKAAIQNKAKDGKTTVVDEALVLSVIEKELKQTQESREYTLKAGKEEESKRLEERAEYLKTFLPQQLSEGEIRIIIESLVKEHQWTSKSDKRSLMPLLMPQVRGKADGKLVNQLVDEYLA